MQQEVQYDRSQHRARPHRAAAALAVVLLLAGCAGTPSGAKVVGMWGSTASGQPNLNIENDGTFSGSDGCNRLSGKGQIDGDEITGIIDWSEAGQGDALYDLATFTLGHEEHLDDVIAGYGTDIDLDVIHAWWSLRSLLAVRWLAEHGFDPFAQGCEVDVLRSR